MGYHTDFRGDFTLSRELTAKEAKYLKQFSRTRRMGRTVTKLPLIPQDHAIGTWGVEGEFYCEDTKNSGQNDHPSIIDHNRPPSTQPSLWCQWVPGASLNKIEWDGREKFYDYIPWIRYIQKNILDRWGVKIIKSTVEWFGEEDDDRGAIVLSDGELIGEDR